MTETLTKHLILVCAGQDAVRAHKSGCPLLYLGLGLHENGGLTRRTLSAHQPHGYLGISDFGLQGEVPQTVLHQILAQTHQLHARGIFADFERQTPSVVQFITQLDALCHAKQLPLFVPIAQAQNAPHAQLIFETAISGGSLAQHIADLRQQHGDRLAASLRTICQRFVLPATDAEGEPLTPVQLQDLRIQHDAQPFFSEELCARYFTYMQGEQAHFVLYDDNATVSAKLRLLAQAQVNTVFALYPDVAHLL